MIEHVPEAPGRRVVGCCIHVGLRRNATLIVTLSVSLNLGSIPWWYHRRTRKGPIRHWQSLAGP
jgi:hypothetical protein